MADTELRPWRSPFFQELLEKDKDAYLFFQKLGAGEAGGVAGNLSIIKELDVTGSTNVDSFSPDNGSAVFYIYYAKSSSAIRGGILMTSWLDTEVADRHLEQDVFPVGDESDLIFSFSYDSDYDLIKLNAQSTNTYRFVALRIFV